MKSRKQHINELKDAISKTKVVIATSKMALGRSEDRLERQRAALNEQLMLSKFDQIDELRQHVSDIISANKWKTDGHIDELEASDKL